MSSITNSKNCIDHEVCVALLTYPLNEVQRQVNFEIVRVAVSKSTKRLLIAFERESDSKSTSLKNYIGDLYNVVWDLALSAGKNLLETIVSIPYSEEGFTSSLEILSKPEVELVVYVRNDKSTKLLKQMSRIRSSNNYSTAKIQCVNDNVEKIVSSDYISYDDEDIDLPMFDKVVLGGTFDYLHNGHKRLLTMTAMICTKEITIGVTSDLMLKSKKFAEKIQPLSTRKGKVREFLRAIKPSLKVNIETIDDAFGPSIRLPDLEAITGSMETLSGCLAVNKIRKERGLKELKIVITSRAQSFTLSSTFLRRYLTHKSSNI
eukprot:g5207.t1